MNYYLISYEIMEFPSYETHYYTALIKANNFKEAIEKLEKSNPVVNNFVNLTIE